MLANRDKCDQPTRKSAIQKAAMPRIRAAQSRLSRRATTAATPIANTLEVSAPGPSATPGATSAAKAAIGT